MDSRGYVPNAEPVAACELRPGDSAIIGSAGRKYLVERVGLSRVRVDVTRIACADGTIWNLPRTTIVTRVER